MPNKLVVIIREPQGRALIRCAGSMYYRLRTLMVTDIDSIPSLLHAII